jgi:hypothetical protein
MDIGLLPHFYDAVKFYIGAGNDAFTINRRTIPDRYTNLDEIPMMYSQIGEAHRGWDCFVFRREYFPNFTLGIICVGAPLIGLALISNLIATANNFRQFTTEHLTFHLGDDRAWNNGVRREYALHNRREALQILRNLEQHGSVFPRKSPPGAYLSYHRNKIFSCLYDEIWLPMNIPMKITHPIKHLLGQ